MIPLGSPELARIAGHLEKYDARTTISQLAGLLTAPPLQANTVRIETLVHLAVAHCQGVRKPGLTEIGNWLNRHLGSTHIASLEDPVEDVFVTNVETPEGNRRVFEGIWESNDYFIQVVLDTLRGRTAPHECHDLLVPALALLRLSDCVAKRVGLRRWQIEPSTPKGTVRVAPATRADRRAHAVTFTQSDLEALDVSHGMLASFVLRQEHKQALKGESTGHSSLERRPLVDFDGELVLALPHAVSPAIRRFVLSELGRMGYLQSFANALGGRQARQVVRDGLWQLKGETESLEPPAPDGQVPSLQAWLLKYDINKHLHVVLLHDRLEWLEAQGLSSLMEYPEGLSAGLESYLSKVATHCRSLPDFTEGITLLVMGGLGRGFMLGFKDWPTRWHLSVIRISDLLMLAGELDRPITRYLKCIKQKEWAEKEGVYFQNINGDYNFYCHWRRLNYQLVPRDLPVGEGSMLSIGNDMVLPVRKEIRNLVDRHVLQTAAGTYSPGIRFGRDAYFKSMQGRPIYASLNHLRAGVLAGAVETLRGPSWLIVEPREGDETVQSLVYKMWDGFIGLYDRLVFEIEALYPQAPHGAVEIRLNLSEIVVPVNYVDPSTDVAIGEPEVAANVGRRTVEIKFPSDFLKHFQQPENAGEKLFLRSVAKGLISLHQGETGSVDETILDIVMNKVIGVSGMRVLHLFHTYFPIEYLLARQDHKPVFLAHEDYVFSKLRLSDGCTALRSNTIIDSKSECNDFLHKIVDKVWKQLRDLLRQLDRASVIREALGVHEAVIHDREHWNRTARAVLALYAPMENAVAVAQRREQDRNQVALPARTILEMAICECPKAGGRSVSLWQLDDLLAKSALLLEAATDSDAVRNDLIQPRVYLHANGEYTVDRDFHNTVIRPFLTAYFREEFEGAARDYTKLYRHKRPGARTRADKVFGTDFITAFRTEFGLTPDEAVDGLAELMDLAVECDKVVVETTLGALRTRLTKVRGLSPDACQAFLRTFSLWHRPAWEKPPQGFKNKDINPWRFRRRLSATARPLLAFGDQDDDRVTYGAGALKLSFGYLLDRTERGTLPQDFYTTPKMKRYIGTVNDRRGHAFARSIADALRSKGWHVRTEVQMTELGGSVALGDIDVLAWNQNREVLLVECKRLQLARTVAEIAEICRRFRGEAKDELHKHLKRVTWIRDNLSILERIVGFRPDRHQIDDRLVTNTQVPMMYLMSLPINADKIGPLKS